jgi:iron(III) transport system substrate-binding protein
MSALVACLLGVIVSGPTIINKVTLGEEGMRGLAGLAVAIALALAPAARADMKALEEAARKEGEITWYTSHYTSEGAEDLGRGFTEMYGIKANVVRMTAQVAYQRVLQDLKKNQVPCDVFSSTDIGHYVRLAAQGRLEKYRPQTESKISPVFRNFDSDGYYHTTSAGLVVLTYNSAKVKSEDAPRKWPDLLDIKWKGKVSIGHPGFSGYVGTWVLTIRNLYGWSFFDRLEKNKPQIGRSINDTVTALNAGERQVAAGAEGSTLFSASRGNPLAVNYPSDGAVLIIAPSAIVKGARHPNAARLFMEYLYSIEASKINARHFGIPLRPEVPSPPGARPISEIKTIRPTVGEIDKGIPEVIEQWRDTYGN